MFCKGTIVSLICLIGWIIYDRSEQRRNKAVNPSSVAPNHDSATTQVSPSSSDEDDAIVKGWNETCRSADALMEKRASCERRARERSEHYGTDFETELVKELKQAFS